MDKKRYTAQELFELIENGHIDIFDSEQDCDDFTSHLVPNTIELFQDGINNSHVVTNQTEDFTELEDDTGDSVDDVNKDPDYDPQQDDTSDDSEHLATEASQSLFASTDNTDRETLPQTAMPEMPQNQSPQKGKKRKVNKEKWKKNIIKSKRAKGENYVSWSGKLVAAKETGADCKCRNKCFNKINEDAREQLLSDFLSIANKDLQDHHLFNMIHRSTVKRRRERTGSRKPRDVTFTYHIHQEGNPDVKVCKQAFMSIHAISKKRLLRLLSHNMTTPPRDMRGRHSNHIVVSQSITEKIKAHINSFPRRQSHYSRKDNPHKTYLDPALSVQRMWLLYFEKEELEQLANVAERRPCSGKVKLWLYRHIFNTHFNLSFGYPRSDTCSKCDELDVKIKLAESTKNDQDLKRLKFEKEIHLRKADKGYECRKEDTRVAKSSWIEKHPAKATDVLTFDFQQNLPTPTLTTSEIFYKRQLWVYIFGIHNCITNKASMYLWPENRARRSVNEVASCITHYLDRHHHAKHIIFYSDGCSGQNRNRFLMAFFMRLCVVNKLSSIDHKFPETGHSRLPNDQDFAHIEKRKRKEQALIPQDWIRIVERSTSMMSLT